MCKLWTPDPLIVLRMVIFLARFICHCHRFLTQTLKFSNRKRRSSRPLQMPMLICRSLACSRVVVVWWPARHWCWLAKCTQGWTIVCTMVHFRNSQNDPWMTLRLLCQNKSGLEVTNQRALTMTHLRLCQRHLTKKLTQKHFAGIKSAWKPILLSAKNGKPTKRKKRANQTDSGALWKDECLKESQPLSKRLKV